MQQPGPLLSPSLKNEEIYPGKYFLIKAFKPEKNIKNLPPPKKKKKSNMSGNGTFFLKKKLGKTFLYLSIYQNIFKNFAPSKNTFQKNVLKIACSKNTLRSKVFTIKMLFYNYSKVFFLIL